ncbi:MAG: TlpA disulfide reductase family protein [Acidobacteriota bacterium]
MKSIVAVVIILFAYSLTFAQNEQSPIVEKDINYKNWTFKNVRSGENTTLRDLTAGKKLVIVVYFAPWCGNWRHDAPILQRLYDKYRSSGLEIVGVGEYGAVDAMKASLDEFKITFPAVYESDNRADKQKTQHYQYRTTTGDGRNWGSPWYIFLEPSNMAKDGDVLVKKTHVINGEMIEAEGEKFIRGKLALSPVDSKGSVADNGKVEVCDPDKPSTAVLKKP